MEQIIIFKENDILKHP